jgi:hypothetical protein
MCNVTYLFTFLLIEICETAGIDDNDPEFEDYRWTYESEKPGHKISYPLNADRFWVEPDVLEGDASGRCVASGVKANIWARARRRAEITHKLCGGGSHAAGWGALKWQETVNTDVVRFGRHAQIRYLAKKVANFLHEYHSNLFPSLDLPILPSDRSRLNVHAMLEPVHIARLLRRLAVSLNYFTLLRNM